jgi:Transglycosylase SLT domain
MSQLPIPETKITNSARPVEARSGVMAALSRAAQATGVDFTYLLKTAQRESALNPKAKAPTSSASGLFQFIEQTWLSTLKSHGAKHGLGAYAKAISQGADGRYFVRDQQARQQVLSLRFNPEAASHMAGELTAGNAAYLRGRIGRNPSSGELYAAHFLGPAGASTLIQAVESRPQASAVAMFPSAAGANRSIFYRQGEPVTVSQLMANLSRQATGSGNVVPLDTQPSEDTNLEPSGYLMARLQKVQSDAQLLSLAFGNGAGEQSLLITTQLLAAFGPEGEGESDTKQKKDSWG